MVCRCTVYHVQHLSSAYTHVTSVNYQLTQSKVKAEGNIISVAGFDFWWHWIYQSQPTCLRLSVTTLCTDIHGYQILMTLVIPWLFLFSTSGSEWDILFEWIAMKFGSAENVDQWLYWLTNIHNCRPCGLLKSEKPLTSFYWVTNFPN